MEPTTQIAAYNTRLEADLVVAKLGEAGIDAFIVVDNLGGTFPMMQMVTGGYRVMVPETLADEATEIALADEEDHMLPEPRRSALVRVLAGLTPTQGVVVLGLMAASLVAIVYAVTRGTL
jgi:hypothetical protein